MRVFKKAEFDYFHNDGKYRSVQILVGHSIFCTWFFDIL